MQDSSLKQLLRTTDRYVGLLQQEGITSVMGLLLYLPRTYEDRRTLSTLATLDPSAATHIVRGTITKKSMITTPRGKRLTEIHFVDDEGTKGQINALNSPFLIKSTKLHGHYFIIGKGVYEQGKTVFRYPQLIEATTEDTSQVGCIYPVYPELHGIKSSRFAKKIQTILPLALADVQDPFPASFLEEHHLPDLATTLLRLHTAPTFEQIDQAKQRILFEKVLKIQLVSLDTKETYQAAADTSARSDGPDRDHIRTFLQTLPFELTHAQKRALKDVIEDIHRPRPMLRLLQGDVGSGKTIVAVTAARYCMTVFKHQVAFLAPIEVLAQQHYKSIAKLLLPLGIRLELLTGSTQPAEKQRIKAWLQQGTIPFVVGTHALLQEDVAFADLGFAIIDEQHKFGVKQRAVFQRHGSPHVLQMTATPIPRSLALAFFGEFENSIIDELPAGRKPITTKIISESEFHKLKPRVLTKINQGQKAFFITPLINESENLDEVKAATQHYQELQHEYPELQGRIGLLHGAMKSADKEAVMLQFKEGKIVMLVSTTVIEVGIDIPEATIMIIYNAERFGLSQLHQLRWRVGRSELQSYCFLETKRKSGDTYQRLRHMELINDGFKLAEIDLKYRGPGEFLGIRQSGDTDIPYHLLSDTEFLLGVQRAAQELYHALTPEERIRLLEKLTGDSTVSLLV